MDFDTAIQAHVEWKTKIRAYIMKHDGTVNASVVSQDNQCALGKWLYGEGLKYNNLPEFVNLKAEHARFHQATAKIIELINSGKAQQAEDLMKAGSDFMKLSGNCVTLIMQMKIKAAK